MRYLSPAFLFNGSLPDPLDKKVIQLERKKLLAELELNAGENIEIHGIFLSKNDIIAYFDELQQENIIRYHQLITEDQALLAFLQDYHIEKGARFLNNQLYFESDFLHWVSPYFRAAFSVFTDYCFREIDAAGLNTLLGNPLLMTPSDEDGAWSYITRLLDNNISRLHYYQNQNKNKSAKISVTIDDIALILSPDYLRMIRLLPENRLNTFRDKYAFAVMEAAIYAFNRNTADRSTAINWIEEAEPMAVSVDIKNALSEKLDEMRKLQKKRKRSMAFRAIWVIFILIRVATCNEQNNDDVILRNNHDLQNAISRDTLHNNRPDSLTDSSRSRHPHLPPLH